MIFLQILLSIKIFEEIENHVLVLYILKKELVNELSLIKNFLLDKGDINLTYFLIWPEKINCC